MVVYFNILFGFIGNFLARLNADGSLDASFNASSDDVITTLALQPDGKILVGGEFSQGNGVFQDGLARLNVDGGLDTSFNAITNSEASVLTIQPDGKILVGGGFTQVNGVGTSSVVRLAADGQIDSYFNADEASGPNAAVSALALQADCKVLVGGSFSQVNGVSHNGLVRLNTDGSLDASFNADTTGTLGGVDALALQPDGKILIGGNFTEVDGVSHDGLARLNTDGSLDASFIANAGESAETSEYGVVYALVLQPDGKVVIGGYFGQVNGVSHNGLARLNADGSLDASFMASTARTDDYYNMDSFIYALALEPDGKILVGGYFTEVDSVSQSNLARLNADGSLDTSFNANTEEGGGVNVIALQSDGKIVIGGDFTQVNGINQSYLTRLNGDGTLDPFFNAGGSGSSNEVQALFLQPDGKLLVGGRFTSIDGVLRNYVARLNGGGAPDFFNWGVPVGGGFYYEQFPNGNIFGYYNLAGNGYSFPFFFHADLGFEYFLDANDGYGGAYLYDFKSSDFFYTSPTFPFPYLYDFGLNAFLYYYPDPSNPGHYNTDGIRYFYDFNTQQIISK